MVMIVGGRGAARCPRIHDEEDPAASRGSVRLGKYVHVSLFLERSVGNEM